jgi:soluble lytic murein transglycosylase-like protein
MRPGSWEPLIDEASQRFSVPQDIITSVMGIESGGQRGAVSPKGASGLMQVMPATYTELAGRYNLGPDRFEPTNNITAGTAYLRENYDKFGNWPDAVRAYNAGPGRVQRVKSGTASLPQETTDYLNNPTLKGVLAQFGGGNTMPQWPDMQRGTGRLDEGMPLFGGRAGGASEDDMTRWGQSAFGGLLNVGAPNQHEGLGTLLGVGQTPSQEHGPSVAANPVGSRIDELIRQISQAPPEPRMGPGGYALAGASDALGQLSGVHDRRVGFGELLGAAGGGMMKGNLAAEKAGLGQRAQQMGELDSLTKVDSYQRAQAASAAKIQAAKQYAAQLRQSNDPEMQQMAAAVELDPNLMDEIIKAQAGKVWEKDKFTTQDRNARSMGLVPGTPAYNDYVQKASMPASTSVNMSPGERQEQKDYGTQLIKEYGDIVTRAQTAQEQRAHIGIARGIAGKDVEGKELPSTYLSMAGNVATALGINVEHPMIKDLLGRVSDAQSFTGVMQNLVLTKMQGQKGSQTEADAKRIESTVALLGNTPAAREFLLGAADALAARDIDQRRFFDQWRSSHGGTFDGAGEAWRQRVQQTPMFATNPSNPNRPVFFADFQREFAAKNPTMTDDQIEQYWREKYGRR